MRKEIMNKGWEGINLGFNESQLKIISLVFRVQLTPVTLPELAVVNQIYHGGQTGVSGFIMWAQNNTNQTKQK